MISCFVATVSDTRTVETDKSGKLIKNLLQVAGHTISKHVIVKDEMVKIDQMIDEAVEHKQAEIILITGGTGIAKRDVTIEVVNNRLEKEIPGFGEIFRMLSYTEDIGSAAMMSQATAGVVQGKAIFAMPGSTGAVKLAMNKLIIPELNHIKSELKK